MLNKYVKKKWIDALRSGKYTKTTHEMRVQRNGKSCFCALGVLCDVIDSKRWEVHSGYYRWGNSWAIIPGRTRNAIHITEKECLSILNLNDSKRKSFNEIADWIEENL